MDPMKISAQFAAFTWYTHGKAPTSKLEREAWQYTEDNWQQFLPNAHPGLGELLLKIAAPAKNVRPRRVPSNRMTRPKLAVAS